MSQSDLQNILSLRSSITMQSRLNKLPIRKSKLPLDFFSPSTKIHNTSIDTISTPQSDERSSKISTPSFNGADKKQQKQNKYIKFRLESEIFRGEQLIRDAVLTSRNLHRYIRKQSVDIRSRCEQGTKEEIFSREKKGTKRNSLSRQKMGKTGSSQVPKLPKIISKRYQHQSVMLI